MLAGLDKFDAAVRGWFADVEEAAAEAAVGLAHEAFTEILENSPQFSGDFTANTRVSTTGTPDRTFVEGLGGGTMHNPFQMGAIPAQLTAMGNAQWTTPKLGTSIFISSTAKHDENYAWKIERGEIALRDVNQGADHIYERAMRTTQHRYVNIGKVQLEALRKATL